MESTRLLIEGIGGIGGLVAYELLKAGYSADLITNNSNITNSINNQGLRVKTKKRIETVPTHAYTHLGDLPSEYQYSMIFLIMKADGVNEAAKQSLPKLTPDGFLCTFQNGVVEDSLVKIVPSEKIVPVTVGFASTMIEPGLYERTTPGKFHIGELNGKQTARIEELSKVLLHVEQVIMTENILGVKWSKLAINCIINTFGAITGQTLGQLLKNKKTRTLFLAVYREIVEVADAKDITLEPIAANPYLLYLPANSGTFKRFTKDLIIRFVGRKYGNQKSSSLQSIQRGRKSEVDYLNGYVVSQATDLGMDVPVNKALTELLHRIDNGEINYAPNNLQPIIDQYL